MSTRKDSFAHWNNIYATKEITSLSWYQDYPYQSIEMIKLSNLKKNAHIIDVGSGVSGLIQQLITDNFVNITALDISKNALKLLKMQLADKSKIINWINSNILEAKIPTNSFELWHDRATMHFLTDKEDRNNYKKKVFDALKPKGYIIIMTFAKNGPDKCSGLPVMKYSIKSLSKEFQSCDLLHGENHSHYTPDGIEQKFVTCLFQSKQKW